MYAMFHLLLLPWLMHNTIERIGGNAQTSVAHMTGMRHHQ
jgi:hypothetical protein